MTETQKVYTEAFLKRTAVLGFISIMLWAITLPDFYGSVPLLSSIVPLIWFLSIFIVTISNGMYLQEEKSIILQSLNSLLMLFQIALAAFGVANHGYGIGSLSCAPSLSFIVSVVIIVKVTKIKFVMQIIRSFSKV